MNLALVGYGKMGKEIDMLAAQRNIPVVARIDIDSPPVEEDILHTIDVVIHFATPDAVVKDVEYWSKRGKNIVVGTTGWHRHLEQIRSIVETSNIGLVYASNFSLGVNVFFHLIEEAGKMFDTIEGYDVFVQETHHKDKIDSPSGTALTLGNILLQRIRRKKEIFGETSHGTIRPEQLHISSTRGGAVVGTHRVIFDSTADSIELTHTAKNRAGFAMGALLAAEWAQGKKGLFTMADVLSDTLR